MNAATPYLYGLSVVAFLICVVFAYSYFGKRGRRVLPGRGFYRAIAIVIVFLLIVQAGALAFLYFNWNNNYVPYQLDPGVQKQITGDEVVGRDPEHQRLAPSSACPPATPPRS